MWFQVSHSWNLQLNRKTEILRSILYLLWPTNLQPAQSTFHPWFWSLKTKRFKIELQPLWTLKQNRNKFDIKFKENTNHCEQVQTSPSRKPCRSLGRYLSEEYRHELDSVVDTLHILTSSEIMSGISLENHWKRSPSLDSLQEARDKGHRGTSTPNKEEKPESISTMDEHD